MNCLPQIKKELITTLLVDGMGTRAICRVADVSSPTVCNFIRDLGAGCLEYLDEHLRDLPIKNIQCDEMWSFVQSKSVPAWTWVAIDPESKLLLTWRIGNRSRLTGEAFMNDVHERVTGGVTITTDAHNVYSEVIETHPATNHSIAMGGGYKRHLGGATTYAVERHNLTLRMSVSRFARSTNSFSKSPMHLNAHLAIYAFHYNFCRVHRTLRVTPAMQALISDRIWSVSEMIQLHSYEVKVAGATMRMNGTSTAEILSRRMDVLASTRRPAYRRAGNHGNDSRYKISRDWKPLKIA